jgi:hypothetical protein
MGKYPVETSDKGGYTDNPTPEMLAGWDPVDIHCPSCGERMITVNGALIPWLEFPAQDCECGFNEPFNWINEDFEARYARAVDRIRALRDGN